MHENHIHSLKQLKQCVSLKQLINALTTITHISHTLVLELIACLEHNHVNTHNMSQSINTSVAPIHQKKYSVNHLFACECNFSKVHASLIIANISCKNQFSLMSLV